MTLIKVKERGRETVDLGRRNLVINGAMQVAQRGTQSGQGASNAYSAVDRFQITSTGTNGRLTSSQSTDAPAGFANSLQLVCTTADTSIAAGELTRIRHRMEGQNLQHIQKGTSGAKPLTLSYHAKASTGGVIIVEVQDADNNRISSVAHTITTSYQKFTHTFPADTTGVLDNDANTSLTISWVLHAGSDYTSGTLGSAFTTGVNANRAVGQTFSIFAATSRQLNLSGVQLEVGSVSTEFEHLSFAENLALCQRYFHKTGDVGTDQEWFPGVATYASYGHQSVTTIDGNNDRAAPEVTYPCAMRTRPTVVYYPARTGVANTANNITIYNANTLVTTSAAPSGGVQCLVNYFQGTSSDSNMYTYHYTADAEL